MNWWYEYWVAFLVSMTVLNGLFVLGVHNKHRTWQRNIMALIEARPQAVRRRRR